MAASPQDWQRGYSLWLQRRSIRRAVCRAQWRGDWAPFGLVLLLLGVLILLTMFLPSKEAVESVKQAAHDERGGSHQLSVVGVTTEP